MTNPRTADVSAVQSISAVPTILRVVAEITGMRFVCSAESRASSGMPAPMRPRVKSTTSSHLCHVVDELRTIHPQRTLISDIRIAASVYCDPKRIAQLLSNLLVNALIYGAPTSQCGWRPTAATAAASSSR